MNGGAMVKTMTVKKEAQIVIRARAQGALIRRVRGTEFELYWPDGYARPLRAEVVDELVRTARVTPEEVA
jgi:hypothetical protein